MAGFVGSYFGDAQKFKAVAPLYKRREEIKEELDRLKDRRYKDDRYKKGTAKMVETLNAQLAGIETKIDAAIKETMSDSLLDKRAFERFKQRVLQGFDIRQEAKNVREGKGAYKDLQDEQQTSVRGGQGLAYDQ